MRGREFVVVKCDHRRFSYKDANEIARRASANRDWRTVLVDLAPAMEATTAGLARLVGLRRELCSSGRDLRIVGLHGRAKDLYQVCHLSDVLPEDEPAAMPADA